MSERDNKAGALRGEGVRMGLDRNELAARFAVALAGREGCAVAASEAVAYTDALLAALSPAPVPAATVPTPSLPSYAPKVGDVVGIDGGKEYGETRVVTAVDGVNVKYTALTKSGCPWLHERPASLLQYIRPATASERAAAGLAEDGSVDEATTPIRTVSPNVVDRTPPAAALTEEERADLRDAIWKERTAWLATGADQRSEPDVYANAAAAWFAKRGGAK